MVAEFGDDGLAPAHDEHRLAAPHHLHHLAFLELRRIDGDRRAERLGPLARIPRCDERNRGECNTHRAHSGSGRRQQAAAAVVDRLMSLRCLLALRRSAAAKC